MTTMAPAGEGGGGGSGTATTTSEQAPATTTTTTTTSTSAPTQHPPPSPLSGCYLLVVLPEPHTAQHKDLILNRLAKGFLSWDKDSCHVDLEKELQALVAQSPEGEEARNGERLIQYATENLVTEVLIYPQSNTLLQCIRNLLASFTKHRHIIHAGYTFGGNGSWILQDGTFSLADFLDAFSEHEVQRVLRAYENSVTVDIHCAGVGDWTTLRLSKEACTRACRVRVNPDDVLTAGVPAITSFTNYIGQYLIAQTLDQLMEPSDVVGNIRFSHPTLYVFPGGQGDAALFGINGFNMLVDGGFARKACFWDFTRHLDRLDAVLVTRINNSNVGGMSSVLKKKKEMHVYPQIGHFFCNLVERRHSNSPDGDKDIDPLILNLIDIGQEMMVNLRHINLRPHPCYRDPEPINLYHKVGHGTLDMYVLSPSKDSREVREFLAKWNASDAKLFAGSHRKDSNGMVFPAQNLVSICALLVWQPANPEDTITRILFPGSTPQHKIFEGFERLKHLEFLKHPTCTAKSLSPSTSLMALKDKAAILKPKLSSIERETKRLAETRREKRDTSEIKAVKKDAVDDASTRISTAKPSATPQIKTETKAKKVVENKKIESEAKESKKIEKELKETKKEVKKVEKSEQPESDAKKTDAVKVETEKTAPPAKEPKTQKIDVKKRETKEITKTTVKPSKPESMTKPSMKPIEKKPKPSGEKKDIMKPSPTTPKKSMNGAATKTEVSKTVAKSAVKTKISTAAPAKSAKDANNRMVVEQKNIESAAASAATKAPAKPKPIERKPISRRTKPVSPSKARLPISPAKSARSTPTASVKSEKDAVIRKVKGGTTDSSAVSTPSGIEPESAIKLIDKNLTEKSEDISLDSIESKVLADLKEEREVVEEIEAVLQKAERIEEARKEERFEGDDEITAEATDKKEEDMTEEDVTAEMDDAPKKLSRKESQELTEEDEYLIVEKEEIYTEDSVQSGDAEQKHHLDEAESEKSKIKIGKEPEEEEEEEEAEEEDQEEEKEDAEEKKDEVPEKSLVATATEGDKRKSMDLSPEHKELLKEEMKQIIASATEAVQKTEEKDDSGKKDSEDITKDPSSLSPDKLDSSVKPDIDQKEAVPEKLEESQERISTLESGATTTAPTLPEDERIPLDEIKEDVDEKHVLEEVKEKEIPVKEKEVIPEALPTVSKPEVKVLDVKPPVHHGIARDVVKTPDEVADLPVHEEVDPKLYRMEELEKDKETKAPAPVQESKEPAPTVAPVKEQKDKGMFSFFGKVADKFEKGIDKLTKKARRDSADKDAEDRSSKSSSPKESKPQEKVIFEDVDIDKVFPKVGKHEEKVESFEQVQPQVSDIKVAAIKETAAFLQEEIKDSAVTIAEPLSDIIDKTKDEKLEVQLEEKVVEGIEEVEELVEEASMKFKNVKDSLQDSLESLEDKADGAKKSAAASADMVKDTLIDAAEKLDDMKSDISDLIESKEPEKVKFIIPPSDDTEKDEDDSDGVVRDFKEAVRDVAEVLMGTSGIEIEKEEKPKDVEQIVKKVAEVLKEDDFLVKKTLFTDKDKEKDESSKSPAEEALIPTKVGVTEEFAPHEEVEEIPEIGVSKRLSTDYQKADEFEVHEEPCTKVHKDKDVTSPARGTATDKEDAMRICEDLLKDDVLVQPIAKEESESRADVMDLGLEEVCVKKVAKREVHDEQSADEKVIVESEIGFEQKLSPGKAELVTVTPGSTPTSPKLPTELELPELPTEYKNIFDKETSLENLIEEFIVVKKHKVTIQVIEYIVIVKRVPKEKVINIIQKTIIKHKIPRDSVADSVQVLRSHDIPSDKRLAIENYITNEYLNKNKRITFSVIEEISMKETIPKSVVIEIVEEIVDKQISRESVFDIPEETYFTILREIDDTTQVSTGIDEKDDDKIVEDFVNISSKDVAEAFIQEERQKSHGEVKVDDFIAVEADHKVLDVSSTSTTDKPDAQKTKDVDEVTEHVSDVIEADEKFVKDTPEKSMKEVSESDSKDISSAKVEQMQDREISEVSEVDTNEKYLDEAKEKTTEKKDVEMPVETLKETHIDTLEKSHADATGRSGGFVDVTEIEQTKDDDQSQDADKESHDGIVKRMVVTASSEDGGHETEICPSGTITFTKSPTPEDSLKEVDVKSTPEKDSLILDKDSLRSAGSTPEKDSIVSDKPDHEDDKITPEDSLEKSGTIVDILQSKDIKTDETTLKELETALDAQKSVGVADQLSSVISSTEMAKTPDSLHSGDASPAESVFSKSPTEKAFPQATELFSHENLITEKIIDDLSAIADKSKSPSVEKEGITDVSHSKADAKSKSSSLEKEIEKKEISVGASAEVKIDDKSKSPSAEKEITQKEMSPDALKDVQVTDRSKSPSSEKEIEKKDMKPEVPGEVKVDDRSKSPSVEKETTEKEMTPELKADIKIDERSKSPSLDKEVSRKESIQKPGDVKVVDKSKSPSVEKEAADKEMSPELHADIKADERSKSPSLEKEVSKKESSQEPDDVKIVEKSKSPSVEKEAADKEMSPELHADIKVNERSKSPSLEKEVSKKESSQEPDDVKVVEKSKSPSVEKEAVDKEMSPELQADDIETADKSKSPSVEKESVKKEISSEAVADDKTIDRSKSPSVEKEVAKTQAATDVKIDDKSKSPSVEKDTIQDKTPETVDRSKSPSLERETEVKIESELVDDGKIHDRSKSPSAEKEIVHKEMSPDLKADERSKSPSIEKDAKKETSPVVEAESKSDDRSKSPSVEKEADKKDVLSQVTADAKVDDRSKSPSMEKEIAQKELPPSLGAKTEDRSKSPSVEKEKDEKESSPIPDVKADKSKSPSVEKENDEKEISPAPDVKADKSKSPSVEKEKDEKEISPAPDVKADKSKSPSVEKEKDEKESSPAPDVKADKSKSPSVEKEKDENESSPASDVKADESKSPSFEKETSSEVAPESKTDNRSKSPSVEKDTDKKDILSEVTVDVKADERPKSPSAEEETHLKQTLLEAAVSTEKEDLEKEKSPEIVTHDKIIEKSKSPSPEQEIVTKEISPSSDKDADKNETLPEATTEVGFKDRPKSPSIEKEEAHKETSQDVLADGKVDRSKSPSVEKDSAKKEMSAEAIAETDAKARSKSPSLEKEETKKEASSEVATDGTVVDRSKSPSVERDVTKKDTSPNLVGDDLADVKSKSPSVEKETEMKQIPPELPADTKVDDRSKSPSTEKDVLVTDMLSELVEVSKTDDRSKSPSIEKDAITIEISPEVTAVEIAQAKSKSPSPDKEGAKKEMSPELPVDVEGDSRSKSPSIEKDASKKEALPEPTADGEAKDRSKSPSVETEPDKKDMSSDLTAKADDGSKSPSVEKYHIEKEASPEVTAEVKPVDISKSTSPEKDVAQKETSAMDSKDDRSKSPSIEKDDARKEMSPDLEADIKAEDESKSLSAEKITDEKETSPDLKTDDRSKSTSVEKDTDKKDISSDATAEVKAEDKSKSPSVEKDTAKKEMSPEVVADAKSDDRSKSPSAEKDSVKEDVLSEVTVDVKADDKPKSPSIEKDTVKKEMSPELATDAKAEDKSKSPSVEKDADKKDVISDTTADAKAEDKSKSPSVEKDADKKDVSSDATADAKIDDSSKSPSVEKDADKKDISSDATAEVKAEDKSPSVEKDDAKKEMSPELATDSKAEDRSKSPSIEKDEDKKDILSDTTAEVKAEDKSKSPSVEKDGAKKEMSPELATDSKAEDRSKSPSIEKDADKKDITSEITTDAKAEDKSKSPSVEKDTDEKDVSSDATADAKIDDRSKSPSVEKDAAKKELSPEVVADTKSDDRSKSPSVEKDSDKKDVISEVTIDAKADDTPKSPSVEKDVVKKEMSPELAMDVKAEDRSKSPSVEKDANKKDVTSEITADSKTEDKSKSPSIQKDTDKKDILSEVTADAKADDRSKSPSVEKDTDKKDILSEVTADAKDGDRSKSPSVEKDTDKKDISSDATAEVKAEDKSKSPSIEKDTDKKDISSDATAEVKAEDKSKSPSIEKGAVKKEMSPELVADAKGDDRSKSPSVEKDSDKKDVLSETIGDSKGDDRSKSPSVEKDGGKKEMSSELVAEAKDGDRSKSPSVEKDADKKDLSSDITADIKADGRSKSPSIEKDAEKKDLTSDITADAKVDDISKAPSVDKDSPKKEISPELVADIKADVKSKFPSVEKDEKEDMSLKLTSDTTIDDKSKSPSVERETEKKELSAELVTDAKFDDKSKSPSVEKDADKKEITSESSADTKAGQQTKSPSPEKQDLKDAVKLDRSKSPSVEKDTDKTVGVDDSTSIDKSKSPSVEKDVKESSEIDTSKGVDESKSPSVEKDSKDKESPEKSSNILKTDDGSKSPSVEKDISTTELSKVAAADMKSDDRSKSPSLEKEKIESRSSIVGDKIDDILDRKASLSVQGDKSADISTSELSTVTATDLKSDDRSKSPSLEKEKIEPRSSIVGDKIDDFLDRKASLSFEGDKSAEKEPAVQRASISEDKSQKSRSPSVSGDLKSEAHDFDKSKSVSPISEKTRADISLLDTADDRKSSIASIESHTEEKGKDRSRSHSLFDTGDKTPLVRSRAASLYEDKAIEKLGVLEHAKDPLGHAHGGIFEETDELRLSQEAIDKLHATDSKEETVHKQDVTPEIRKAIEDYVFGEYVIKKKLITLSTIHEISVIYNIDQHIIMRIINEIISDQRIKRETIVDFEDKEHEETSQKLLDDEENLTHYIDDEFISKKKKIDSKTVDTIASAKSVSRHLVIVVIENIISSRSLRRESIVDGDFTESHDSSQKEDSHTSTNIVFDKDSSSRKESLSESLKPSVETKSMSPSPEPSLTYKLGRPDPHIDEEITISENKRIEVETLLIDEYITRGIKITETILEQIVTKTSLPKYIIVEIIEEILIKKHLSKDAIADKSIFHDDDDDSQHKLEYEGMATPEISERKSSGYSTPDTRNYEVGLEKGGQYSDYESPFHKAFMGGMTEIRTTHITTLSGKSTPDFGQRTETPESISETTDNAKTTITSVPGQFESTTGDDSHPTSSASQSKTEETVQEPSKTTEEIHSQLPTGETVVVLKTTQITTYPEETVNITKEFITHESMSDEDPTKKQVIEQDESETITKVIKHEVVHMTGEPVITKRTSISGGDYNQEFITKEITKTITSQEEIDPVSLFDTFGTTSTRKSVDHTETSSVSDGKATELSTVSPSAINIEEKLISLDSHPSDTSKTSISSMSSHDSKADSSVVHEEKHTTFFSKDLMDHTIPEQLEQSAFPLIRDLITDDKSYSGKSSPDVSLPKDIVYGGSTGKSTPDVSMSPLMRDGSMMQSHLQSGRSTPDKRSDRGSRTATPEGFRSGDVIRTIITTTRTMSDDGEIITTTQEVTEATNEKGETIVITEKTDVKVDERLPETKPIDIQRAPSASSDKEFDPTSPRSDLSSGHSRAATHMWGSSDERHTYSDDEQPSPTFSSSPYQQDSSVKEGTFKTPDDFASAAMSSSFYGELPEESIHFHTSTLSKTVQQVLPEGEPDEFSFKKFTVEKEFAGGFSDKGSKKYVDEADLDFEKALTEEKSEHDRGQGSSVLGAGDFSQELEKSSDQSKAHPADDKKDPLADWGTPLGLPSPKAPRKFNLRSPIQPCSSADLSPDSLNFDVINDWGEPMRLPSPAPTQANEVSNKGSPGTPKKEKKQAKKVLSENIKNKKRSESPSKNDKRVKDSKNKVQPVYVDLTYVSHHGNSFYTALEFFKKVRARYYVFSGTEPSREVYDALLEAKKTWEDKDLEVTMIPTYDTDTLGYWVADNEEALAAHHIDLSPSASRCTINLQDHETSCSAYRLEF